MNLYLSIGIPEGYSELDSGITFEPKLVSLSTNKGSAGGSLITAVVKGVGEDDDITLYDSATSTDICETATVTAYGTLECLTVAMDISAGTVLSIEEIDSGTVHACAAVSTADC